MPPMTSVFAAISADRHADHEQRAARRSTVQVEHHPDREEEQAEQDRAERLDVGLELVADRACRPASPRRRRRRARSRGRALPSARRRRRPRSARRRRTSRARRACRSAGTAAARENARRGSVRRSRQRSAAPSASRAAPPFSAGLRLSAATIVSSGMIDRSWNSRIANARSPNGLRNGRPTAASAAPARSTRAPAAARSRAPRRHERPLAVQSTPNSARPHSTTCASPKPKISLLRDHSRDGLSSRPTMNSSSVMPNSAMPTIALGSLARPSTCGPTTAPATSQPSVAPSPSRRNSSTNARPKPSNSTPSRRIEVPPSATYNVFR